MKIINEYLKLKFIGKLLFFIFLSFFINKTFTESVFDYKTEADYYVDSKKGNEQLLEGVWK